MAKGIGDAISELKSNLAAMLANVDDLEDAWETLSNALGNIKVDGHKGKTSPTGKVAKKGGGKRRPKRTPEQITKAVEAGAKAIATALKGSKEGMGASELAKAAKVSDLDFNEAIRIAMKTHGVKRTGKRGGTKYHHG